MLPWVILNCHVKETLSHRKYTDRLEIDLKTQLCDFTERERETVSAWSEDRESERYN